MGNEHFMRFGLMLSAGLLLLLQACSPAEVEESLQEKDGNPVMAGWPKGSLFIIGGGSRPDSLIQRMFKEADLGADEYVVILTMASSEPDTAFLYSATHFKALQSNPVHHFNLSVSDVVNKAKLDSISSSGLIYITGGDQLRFMNVVADNPIAEAIAMAYEKGALIGGTSAGAAVMSSVMITGDENYAPEYSSTYKKIWKDNGVYASGLGFVDWAVIDQHFIVRSRYNRLISALVDYPGLWGVGIDESTALLVSDGTARVCGASQVVVMRPPSETLQHFLHSGLKDVQMDVLLAGDSFQLPK